MLVQYWPTVYDVGPTLVALGRYVVFTGSCSPITLIQGLCIHHPTIRGEGRGDKVFYCYIRLSRLQKINSSCQHSHLHLFDMHVANLGPALCTLSVHTWASNSTGQRLVAEVNRQHSECVYIYIRRLDNYMQITARTLQKI